MRCVRCNKPLLAGAAYITTGQGGFAWGPKCARKAGLVAGKRGAKLVNHTPKTVKHEEQLSLELE